MPLTEADIIAIQNFIAADGRPVAHFWGVDPDEDNRCGITVDINGRKVGIIRTRTNEGDKYTAEPIATDNIERDRVAIDMTGVPLPDFRGVAVA